MTSPDQVARIKNVLMDTEKLCGNCKYNRASDCARPGGLCKLFDAVWDALDYIKELEEIAEAVMKEGEHEKIRADYRKQDVLGQEVVSHKSAHQL